MSNAVRGDDSIAAFTAKEVLDSTVQIVAAYVGNQQMPQDQVPVLLRSVHSEVRSLANMANGEAGPDHDPFVSVKKSITDDFIVCLEDGKKLRTLKRYLMTQYKLTPDEYRRKWNLPRDYPMVAPSYTRLRSAFAKKIGLGRVSASTKRRPKK